MEKKEKGNSVIISSLMPSFIVQKNFSGALHGSSPEDPKLIKKKLKLLT